MADDKETSAEEEVVESLIQGRARRSTAGRHLSALLNAEADDELALLFEEVDDDNEFSINAEEEAEEEDLALDSSSSDDEDQGPNVRGDDLEGEKEIEKEAKADRQKRRAREDLRLKLARKKVKIDPSAVSAVPAPRPKKKSERISWLPTVEDGPTRSSSRRQTMQNKQLTHARLKDSEEKRIRLIATMEEAAKRKAHLKPREMTQADRLAEAERVERLNSKSLSRWEEMEKRKAEERRAKIEALQNRRLEGPVMSYWSGIATWVNGHLTRVGKVDITPKPEKEETTRKKSKKTEKEEKSTAEKPAQNAPAGPATSQTASLGPSTPQETPAQEDSVKASQKTEETMSVPQEQDTDKATTASEPTQATSAPEKSTVPEGSAATAEPTNPVPPVESTAAPGEASTEKAPDSEPKIKTDTSKEPVEVESKTTGEAPQENETAAAGSKSPGEAPMDPTQAAAQVPEERPAPNADQSKPEAPLSGVQPDGASKTTDAEAPTNGKPSSESKVAPPATSPAATQVSAAAPTQTGQQEEPKVSASTEQKQIAPEIHVDQPAFSNDGAPQPQIPAPPPVVEQTGRCLTILENFDEETAQSREFSIYFNSKKPPRLTSTCTFSETLRLDDQADLFSRNLLVTLCYHISSFTFPGSRDLSPFCQRICISRNPTDCCPKVCVESHARLLCWSCRYCGARGASTIPQS
jgi:vacuolar protein sorting-associated protein 72